MLIKICHKCKGEKVGRFCNKCGSKLVVTNICPQCKKESELEGAFCSHCGAKMDESEIRIPRMRGTLHP